MKQAICCLLSFILLGYGATAQIKNFLRNDSPKNPLISKSNTVVQDKQQAFLLRIPYYTVRSLAVGDLNISPSGGYLNNDPSALNLIFGVAATILASTVGGKRHAGYTNSPPYYFH